MEALFLMGKHSGNDTGSPHAPR